MSKRNFSHSPESDSPGEMHFHYSREERLRSVSPEVASRMDGNTGKKKGLFRGNRALMILLLDILFILLLYFILTPILQNRGKTTRLEGYSLQLSCFEFEDKLFFSLKAAAEEDHQGAEQNLVKVIFSSGKSENSITVSDLLPSEKGQTRILRGQLPKAPGKDTAEAEVHIGGQQKLLRTDIRPE